MTGTGHRTIGRGEPSASYTGRGPGWNQLAEKLSDLSRDLQYHRNTDGTLEAIVLAAVDTVPGVEFASISAVVRRREVHTRAATGELPRAVDQAQYATGQGPYLSSRYEQRTVRSTDLATEARWPQFVVRARKVGLRSMLAIQLYVTGEDLGALNLQSTRPDAFTDESEQVGLLFAAHAAVAMAGAQAEEHLRSAITSRDLIGQAKGILMERFKISEQEAFRLLVVASQTTNIKLSEVATYLTRTGPSPPVPPDPVRELSGALAAATATASSLGLPADDAVVLQDSNRLTVRLLPADVVGRVEPVPSQVAAFELEIARRLTAAGSPVAAPDPRVEPRVHERDGFAITLWTHHEPLPPHQVPPADYADALRRLHAGMRGIDVPAPHVTERVDRARQLVASPERTPALADADRQLLAAVLENSTRVLLARGRAEQLLHGEPHPGNVLTTRSGLLFVDFETCCRGPVEFDVAHANDDVGDHYPGVDRDLLRACRAVVLALVTTWRWDRDDQLPDGHRLGTEWLTQLRTTRTRGDR